MGGFAALFACGLFEFWRGGRRSRKVFLKVFARWLLILSDDNKLAKSVSAKLSYDFFVHYAPPGFVKARFASGGVEHCSFLFGLVDLVVILLLFQKSRQNGRPGRREAPPEH